MKRCIFIILTVLWMSVIFIFSNSNGNESLNTSGFIVNRIVPIVEKVINKELTQEQIDNFVSYPIRKCAHFTEYMILGILVSLVLSTYEIKSKDKILISILICMIYSLSDEIHQLFIDERNGSIIDVVIDSIGSLCGILILKLRR